MRFSLLSLMLFVLFAAVLCSIFLVVPGGWSVLLLTFLSALLLASAVAGIVFGAGVVRAFSIGYAVSATFIFAILVAVFIGDGRDIVFRSSIVRSDWYDRLMQLKFLYGGYFVTNLLSGMAAEGVYQICLRNKQHTHIESQIQVDRSEQSGIG